MKHTIAIVATLDTKAREIVFLQGLIEELDCATLLVDVGVFEQSEVVPDVSREQVAAAADSSIARILARRDRKSAIDTMMKGGALLLRDLYDQAGFSAIVSAAGGTGTHIASGVMRARPVGVPKLLVSTVASRDMSGVIGSKDITVMHSVADIIGLNFMTRKILADAASAVVGMARSRENLWTEKRVVALTSFGPLSQCASLAHEMLERLNYEVVPFHAVGSGSMAMEDLIDQGVIHGVLDFCLHEFADQMVGGYCKGIGPGRLETAGRKGVPHVILPGGLDMLVFECTSIEGVPEALRTRQFLPHDFRSFVRTTADDLAALGRVIADKLNRATVPPTVIIPLQGWSKVDAPGGPFYEPETDQAFVRELKRLLKPGVRVLEVEASINDEPCVRMAVTELQGLMCEAH